MILIHHARWGGGSIALSDEAYKCAVHIPTVALGIPGFAGSNFVMENICRAIGTTTDSMALAVQVFGQVGVAP